MVRYEIRERTGLSLNWRVVAWFSTIEKARDYWSTSVFDGVQAALVRIEYTEIFEHYHSADGKEVY